MIMTRSFDTRFKLSVRDLMIVAGTLATILGTYYLFDKRLSMTEAKLDSVVELAKSVQKIAMDHEKRIIILEQHIK